MKRKLRWVLIVFAVIILLIIALPFFIDVNRFRPVLESQLSKSLGRPVSIGNLKLSILAGGISADEIAIADDPAFSPSPFVTAKSFSTGVEILPLLFSRQLHVTGLKLVQPQITLLRDDLGKWNFSSLGGGPSASSDKEKAAPSSPATLTVRQMEIIDGQLSIGRANSKLKPQVYEKVNIRATNLSLNSQFPFTLAAGLPGGGELKLDGQAGPVNHADSAATPLAASINVTGFNLGASGLIEPTAGISGLVDFEGTLTSDGQLAHSEGRAKASQLQLVKGGAPARPLVVLEYNIDYDVPKQAGVLRKGDVHIGQAVAHLTGSSVMSGESIKLDLELQGKDMNVDELEAMLPAAGVKLPTGSMLKGGVLSMKLDISGPMDKLVTVGPVKLANTQLAGFDLGSKLAVLSKLAGIKRESDTSIQNVSADLRHGPNGIRVDNLNVVVPSLGEITGNGTISPENALDFKMVAKLTAAGIMGDVTRLAGLGGKSDTTIPFSIRGTATNPEFVPDVKGMAKSTVQSIVPSQAVDTFKGLFGKKKKN